MTNKAIWTSGNGRLASVVAPGHVTGHERGTAMIEARLDGHRGRREVFVLPTGTFRLYGRLTELHHIPLAGARVEVTTGAGAGLTATTDIDGVFYLYGVAGATTLRVSRDGYSSKTHTITVLEHQWITIELSSIGNRPDLSGTYTLTISAANECGIGPGTGNLPDEVRVRSYPVTAQQDGSDLLVSVSGVEFNQTFWGYVQSDTAIFWLRNPDDGTPIGQRLSTSRTFWIEGTAVVAITPGSRLEGTLSGNLDLRESSASIASCSSTSHSFVLSR
jgi:hypothetical protein